MNVRPALCIKFASARSGGPNPGNSPTLIQMECVTHSHWSSSLAGGSGIERTKTLGGPRFGFVGGSGQAQNAQFEKEFVVSTAHMLSLAPRVLDA